MTTDRTYHLPPEDTDISLVLPNGQIIELQWRVESPCLDVCLPEATHPVTCWEGGDLEPAKTDPRHPQMDHVRCCGQLAIAFGDEVLDEPERSTKRKKEKV